MAKKDWQTISIMKLTKHANSNSNSNIGARRALDDYYKLKEAGGDPEIRYSEFHGYRVTERNS